MAEHAPQRFSGGLRHSGARGIGGEKLSGDSPKKKKAHACFAIDEAKEVTGDTDRQAHLEGSYGIVSQTVEEMKANHAHMEMKATQSQQIRKRMSKMEAKQHDGQISLEDFTGWTKSCGVFKIQREYEILAGDAKSKGISIEEEMRANNFKSYDQFARSCERFALNCWPGDFSELGCGFVLYYHFLLFLGIVLVLSLFAQVPAMIYYSGYDNVKSWYFHEGDNQNKTVPSGLYLVQWSLTPGNLGPDAGENWSIIICYMVLLILVCLLFIGELQHQNMVEKRVDYETTSPSDFAIMAKELPATATDEGEIKKFFSKHAVEGQTTEIVKVVIGWDADFFRDEKEEIDQLELKILKCKRGSDEEKKLKQQVAEIKKELADSIVKKEMESSGVVVIVFRYQKDLRACLKRWGGFWSRWLNRETEDLPFLPRGNGLRPGAKLPRFPVGNKDEPPACIEVERAPNPGDIQWDKLGIRTSLRIQKMAVTNTIMVALVFGAFWATWGLQELKDYIRDKGSEETGTQYYLVTLLSFLPGLGVAVVNMLLSFVARYFGEQEFHDSVTDREFAISFKMCLALMVNTSGVIMWTHWDPAGWYQYGGLAEDILWVMLADGIGAHFCGFFDFEWYSKWCARRRVTAERCKEWTELVRRNAPPITQDNFEVLKDVRQEVLECKKAFEPYEVDMAERFASAVNSFVFVFIFQSVLPLLPLIGLIGVVVQYWCDKYLLLRWVKRPTPQNMALARYSLRVLKWLVPAFWCGSVYVYLEPSWNYDSEDGLTWLIFLICLGSCVFYSVVPMHLWALIICRPCCIFEGKRRKLTDESFEDYYNAQSIWQIPYHHDQFLYKELPEEKNPKILKAGEDHVLKASDYNFAAQSVAKTVSMGMTKTESVRIGGHTLTTSADWFNSRYGGWGATSTPVADRGGGYGCSSTPLGSSQPRQTLHSGTSTPLTYGNVNKPTTPQGGYIAPSQTSSYGQQQASRSNPAAYGNPFGSNPAAYGYNTANPTSGWPQTANTGSPQVSYGAHSSPFSAHNPGGYSVPAAQTPPSHVGAAGKTAAKNYEWPAAAWNRPVSQSSAWEFELNGAFQLFDWASQAELEAKYQAFISRQGGNMASMNLGGITYTVDFNCMTMLSPGTARQRIRRRDKE